MRSAGRAARQRVALLCAVLLGLASGGCVARHPTLRFDAASPQARRDLAGGAGEPTTTAQRPNSAAPTPFSPSPAASSAIGAPTNGVVAFVDVSNTAGDQDDHGPPYADARRLQIQSAGDQVSVIVTMAGHVPAKLSGSETMGVGIDFYRPGGTESDYQLFGDGEPDGWYPNLDGPSGSVSYPGTLRAAEDQLIFTVPWSALGDMRTGEVSGFVDWTRSQQGASPASEDHVPGSGRVSFTR